MLPRLPEQSRRMNGVFGVFGRQKPMVIDAEVERLIAERREARSRRDFARADAIRDQLAAQRRRSRRYPHRHPVAEEVKESVAILP